MVSRKARIRTKCSVPRRGQSMAIVSILATLTIAGCTMSETQQRVGSGAAIGALAGGLIGGNNKGAVLGAAVGAGGGYLVDQRAKRQDAEDENERLRRENERLRRQQ